MRTKLLGITLGLLIAGGAAMAQQRAPRGPMMMDRHPMLMAQLKLTDQQKTEARKVWFDLMQKQIDVRAQLQHARLDYHELASATSPDQKALSAKIQDMANLRAQLQQNKLDAWFAVNKLLTAEQQKVWQKVLEHPMMFNHKRRAGTMMMRKGSGMGGEMRGPQGMMNGRMQWMQHNGSWQRHMGPMMQQDQPSSPDTTN